MKMTLKQVGQVLMDSNIDAAKIAAKQDVGGVVLDRLVKAVKPKAPVMVRGYLEEPWGKLIVANAFAAAVVRWFPDNDKAVFAADAAVKAANRDLFTDFDLRGMLDDILDGIAVPAKTEGGE